MTDIFERLRSALGDRHAIQRELGSGGMATVYLAEDLKHKRQVAVKVLHPDLAAAIGSDRFVREIEIAAKLTHPHILMLIDSGEADGFLFYVMPYVDGESLRDRLVREKKLSTSDAVRIMEQVASALNYAHQQGVVHRDIKPENILLSGDHAIVADFGIARAVQVAGGEKLTATGIAIGTPAYMSPEQAFAQDNVDGCTDVYAMGCVLFEMVAGRTPFESTTPHGLLAQHAVEAVPSLRGLDPDVPLFIDRAVGQALAKEPGKRFNSPKAFAETLRSETVVAPVGRRRLAVLPPVNITNDPEQQFLVLGLHEAMISQLGRGNVAVLARTSVLQYQGTERPVRDICRELSVDAVIESSMFRAGDSVAIQARLIDGNTEEGIWSGSYDGDVSNVLSLYRELSGSIAQEIHGALDPKGRPSVEHPSVNPIAYEKYMRGRVYQQSFTPDGLDRAMQYYEAALEIEPGYAPAYAGISLIWGSKVVLGMVPPLEYGPKWREAAERAVELDPNLAEGHQALAQGYTWFEFDWERAEEAYKRAIELDPNEPQARIFYSHFLAMLCRTEESDVQIKRALEIDPLNPFTQLLRGAQLGNVGRHEEAMEQLVNVPAGPLRSQILALQHFKLGRLSEALTHYVQYFQFIGDHEMVRVMLDDGAGPRAAMVRGAETLVERSSLTFVKPEHMVFLFTWADDIDRGMEWLERSYQMRDHQVAYAGCLGVHTDALRADPRLHEFLRRLKLPVPEASI
jgi:serine/threonine-protein kinase